MGPKKQKKKKQLVSEYNACSVNGLKQGINNIVLVLKMRNNFSNINDNDVRISTVAYSWVHGALQRSEASVDRNLG